MHHIPRRVCRGIRIPPTLSEPFSTRTCPVQEVVALGGPQHPPAQLVAAAAPHVPPHQWHALLEAASGDDTVLLDVRNRYETRVGHFRKVCRLIWLLCPTPGPKPSYHRCHHALSPQALTGSALVSSLQQCNSACALDS